MRAICSITDLARNAKALVEQARQAQEPIVITQRGREAAVLVPIGSNAKLEGRRVHRMPSIRPVNIPYLIDSGSDISANPTTVASDIGADPRETMAVQGYDGSVLGRDTLNDLSLLLDGPTSPGRVQT